MDDILDDLIKGTDKKLTQIERLIYVNLLEYLTDNLTVTEKKIKFNQTNIGIVEKLDSISDKFGAAFKNLTNYIIRGIIQLVGVSAQDLKKFDTRAEETGVKVIDEIAKHAATSINQNLNLKIVFSDIKQEAISLMSRPEGISLGELRQSLENKVVGKKIASRYYSRWTHDIYSQYQRVGANRIRTELGLKYAIYQGGLIETSRKFCNDRNGKVVSEDEVKGWINLDWEGKPETGYSPIADLGGYNCRHRLDWISDELAKRLRPDLF